MSMRIERPPALTTVPSIVSEPAAETGGVARAALGSATAGVGALGAGEALSPGALGAGESTRRERSVP